VPRFYLPAGFRKIGNPAIEIGVSPGFEYRESWDGADGTGFGFDLTWDQQTYGGGYVGTSSKILGSKLAFVSYDRGVGAAEPGDPLNGYAAHNAWMTNEEWSPTPALYPFNTSRRFVEARFAFADDLTPFDTEHSYGTQRGGGDFGTLAIRWDMLLFMYASDASPWSGGWYGGISRNLELWGYWNGAGGIMGCDPCGPSGTPPEAAQPGEPAAPWFYARSGSDTGWTLGISGSGLGSPTYHYDPATYAPVSGALYSFVERDGVVDVYQDGVLMIEVPVLSEGGKAGSRCGVHSDLVVPTATASYYYDTLPPGTENGIYTRDLTGTSLFTLDNFRMGDTPLWAP
jgi:hypothetical protein